MRKHVPLPGGVIVIVGSVRPVICRECIGEFGHTKCSCGCHSLYYLHILIMSFFLSSSYKVEIETRLYFMLASVYRGSISFWLLYTYTSAPMKYPGYIKHQYTQVDFLCIVN